MEGLNDARTPHRTSCVLGQRGCLGRLREGGLNIRLGWAGEKGNFFNACWNSTGDPALRWEVARMWRLGRQVIYVNCLSPAQTEARATVSALDN